jgi:hypothetical protein
VGRLIAEVLLSGWFWRGVGATVIIAMFWRWLQRRDDAMLARHEELLGRIDALENKLRAVSYEVKHEIRDSAVAR